MMCGWCWSWREGLGLVCGGWDWCVGVVPARSAMLEPQAPMSYVVGVEVGMMFVIGGGGGVGVGSVGLGLGLILRAERSEESNILYFYNKFEKMYKIYKN